MPNTADSVGMFLAVIQSGLVVSGNSYITATRQLTSGDAINLFSVSGNTELIALRLMRNQSVPMTGGVFTEVYDYVAAEIHVHLPYAGGNTSGAVTILDQRVNDYKITIASGGFSTSGMSRPRLVQEEWPTAHEKAALARLVYRVGYLL